MEKVELFECLSTSSEDLNKKDKQFKSLATKYPWITKDVS